MKKGQITIELLLALTIGALILLTGAQLIVVGVQSSRVGEKQSIALSLAQEGQAAAEVIKEEDWFNIYNLTKDSPYRPEHNGSGWSLASGTDEPISGYTRSIVINNVQRDEAGNIVESGTEDPSTQKVTVTVSSSRMRDIVLVEYLSRWENEVKSQTNWIGGAGQDIWSDETKYWADEDMDVATAGEIKLAQAGAVSWWDENYKYRKKITFDNSGQTEDLGSFPVLVKLTSPDFDFSKARSDGFDVRFVDTNNVTVLKLERERYDQSGEVAEIWVKVNTIDGSSNTDYIYMYYGYDDASDAEDPEGVWDSHYMTVQHLDESSKTAGDYNDHLDSTVNDNDGEAELTPETNMDATGQINGADNFDGNDYVEVADDNSLDFGTGDFYLSAWIKPSAGDTRTLFGKRTGWQDKQLEVFTIANDNLYLRIGDGGARTDFIFNVALSNDAWHHVVFVREGTTYRIYVDNVENEWTGETAYNITNDDPFYIGKFVAGNFFKGIIDEVRVSDTARSANWIAAQYLSMTDAFCTFADEERVAFGNGADGAVSLSANFNINTEAKISERTYPDGVAYRVGGISDKTITLTKDDEDTNGIAAEDEILLINLKGSDTDFDDVGNYEFLSVASVSGKTITVNESITKSYDGSGASYDTQKVVVQRAPNYTDVTTGAHNITAGTWDNCISHDGISGCNDVIYTGMVIFRASGTVTISASGSIDVSSKGFSTGEDYGAANSLVTTDSFSKIGLGPGADVTGAGGGIIWIGGKTATASADAYQFIALGGNGTDKGAGGGSIKITSKNLTLGGTGTSDEAVKALGGTGTEAGGNGKIYLSYRTLDGEDYADGSESNEECDPDVSGSAKF